jgi:hypothetical protein
MAGSAEGIDRHKLRGAPPRHLFDTVSLWTTITSRMRWM